jgi:PAS domain S-box-containing protein
MQIVFILLLPMLVAHFSFCHLWLMLELLIPIKLCMLYVYFFMFYQQVKLRKQLKHCFDMMMVTSEAIVIHKDGKILDVNPAFQKLFGYTYEQCEHMTLYDIFSEVPFECLKGHQNIASFTSDQQQKQDNQGEHSIPQTIVFECIGKTSSGKQIELEVISKIQNYLGEDVYVLGIRNIQSRRQKETVLENADDLKAKNRFLSVVSHELKTPLNAIQLLGELIEEQCVNMDDVRENAKIIQKCAHHLLTLIKDILDYSKLEVGTLVLYPEVFDIVQRIEDAIDIVSQKAYEKELELSVYIPRTIPRKLYGDPNRFQQILSNLVSNAIKFTDSGQVIVSFEVKKETNSEVVLYTSVKDSGIGIAKADQKKLFRMFSQVDSSAKRRYEGAGLGLAICKQLVSLMGGSIGVKSSLGHGSTFWFTVVFKKPSAAINSGNPVQEELSPFDLNIYGPNNENEINIAESSTDNMDKLEANQSETSTNPNINPPSGRILERRSRDAIFINTNENNTDGMVILKDLGGENVTKFQASEKSDSTLSNNNTPESTNGSNVFDNMVAQSSETNSPNKKKESRVLVVYQNAEASRVLCKYLNDFNAEYILSASIVEVLNNLKTYLEKPLEAIIIDDSSLMAHTNIDVLTLIKQLKRGASIMNRKYMFKPSVPLMVLILFSKAAIDEDILLQFNLLIRKPLYLSSIEKLFYNDLVVHRKYSVFEKETEDIEDLDLNFPGQETPSTTENASKMENTLPKLRSMPLTSSDSMKDDKRIFVSFEVRSPRRFSSLIRRSSLPTEKVSNEKAIIRRTSLNPEIFSFKDISRFKSPRNIRLSRFIKLMFRANGNSSKQFINTVLDKIQRLRSIPRVLMVEDQVINQKVTKRIIESLGVHVEIAPDGKKALEMLHIPLDGKFDDILAKSELQLFDYDLVLMDGNMPELDGIETTRRIRKYEDQLFANVENKEQYRIPIIGLTASSEEAFQKICLQSGMNEVLTKPIKRKELEKMLQKYLEENEEWKILQKEKQFNDETSEISNHHNIENALSDSNNIHDRKAYEDISNYKMNNQ